MRENVAELKFIQRRAHLFVTN